ncbi:MAG: M23 family metallopeptidase [Fibrobacter sp.]|jgi:murein DD-endopeptidase MepM/ murein hydrolase activator NlpD|nr:M23 family metallopeptidase [Fibrobacter sp.]
MKKEKTILIVPPRGTPAKAIKIRLSVAVAFMVLVTIGFAGYFIPFNSFTLNIVEQNQQKNLTDQNRALLQRVLSSLKLLNNLKEQVARLEDKRQTVLKAGTTSDQFEHVEDRKIDFSRMQADELLRYAEIQESKLEKFISFASNKENFFNHVPVIYPVAGSPIISRRFGSSKDPFSDTEKWHYGTDFVAEEGTDVISTASGTISRVENHPVWGRRVYIDHGEYQTVYAHLGKVSVIKGKRVKRGDVIGTVGMSGLSTGPHVHYEIWYKESAVNPEKYFFHDIGNSLQYARSQ